MNKVSRGGYTTYMIVLEGGPFAGQEIGMPTKDGDKITYYSDDSNTPDVVYKRTRRRTMKGWVVFEYADG